jgi:hypothetical protein
MIKPPTTETIREAMNAFYDKKEKDDNVLPDVEIQTDEDTFFSANINGAIMVSTGIGGFKMYAKNWKNFDILKIRYNGVILSKEQKQDLFNQLIS